MAIVTKGPDAPQGAGVYLEIGGKLTRIDSDEVDPLHNISVWSPRTGIPPAAGQPVMQPIQEAVALLNAGKRFFFPADEAIRNSRSNARNMPRDLDIMEPLQTRLMTVAQLPGHVEPEDKRDKYQIAIAKELNDIIEATPHFTRWKLNLLEAVWYGHSAVQNLYYWNWSKGFKRLMVREYLPINGDSLVYKWSDERIAIRVGASGGWSQGLKTVTTEPADVSRVHTLTDEERISYVHHVHMITAGDFFDPQQMGQVKGVGIRSQIYWVWYLKSELLGLLTEYLERQGSGFTIFYFEKGNPASLEAVQQLAAAQSFQNIITWPRMPGQEHDDSGIERIEPGMNAVENFMRLLDSYWAAQIRRFILGQELTSTSKPTGLGSNLASIHENTFMRLIKYDSDNLAETITREYLQVVQEYTFPEADFACKWVIDCDKPEPEKFMKGVKDFIDVGGTVAEDDVRAILGLRRPDEDEDILGASGVAQPQEPILHDPRGIPDKTTGVVDEGPSMLSADGPGKTPMHEGGPGDAKPFQGEAESGHGDAT
jgi:hypothetical protein